MAARTWALVVLAILAVAGCAAPEAPAPEEDAPVSEPAPAATPPTPRPAARPDDVATTDAGVIQGTFARTWRIDVPNVAFREAGIRFTLTGVQPDLPPAALVHLALYDPTGAPVEQTILGLGAPANELVWSFTPGELPLPGTYELRARDAPQGPAPSLGAAAYQLDAHVRY